MMRQVDPPVFMFHSISISEPVCKKVDITRPSESCHQESHLNTYILLYLFPSSAYVGSLLLLLSSRSEQGLHRQIKIFRFYSALTCHTNTLQNTQTLNGLILRVVHQKSYSTLSLRTFHPGEKGLRDLYEPTRLLVIFWYIEC